MGVVNRNAVSPQSISRLHANRRFGWHAQRLCDGRGESQCRLASKHQPAPRQPPQTSAGSAPAAGLKCMRIRRYRQNGGHLRPCVGGAMMEAVESRFDNPRHPKPQLSVNIVLPSPNHLGRRTTRRISITAGPGLVRGLIASDCSPAGRSTSPTAS